LVLSLRDNSLATKEGGKALAQALTSNSTLKELDVSNNWWREGDGPGFAQELAVGIKDNEALTSLDISSNSMANAETAKALGSMLKGNTVLKKLDISDNVRGCGSTDGGVQLVKGVAEGLVGNGALLHLDASNNKLGALVPPEGWTKGNYISQVSGGTFHWSHTDGRKEEAAAPSGSTPDGVIALADAIPGMRALIKLDISSNNIGGEQEEELQRICVASGIELVK
jgi:Ran GTPase-activating protein (RanGAP) involved in mRNA processing and transport